MKSKVEQLKTQIDNIKKNCKHTNVKPVEVRIEKRQVESYDFPFLTYGSYLVLKCMDCGLTASREVLEVKEAE